MIHAEVNDGIIAEEKRSLHLCVSDAGFRSIGAQESRHDERTSEGLPVRRV